MAISQYKKLPRTHLFLYSMTLALSHAYLHADLTSLAKNDAYPVFSTLNSDDAMLLTAEQLRYKKLPDADKKKSRARFSISPFAQNADKGNKIKGHPCPPPVCIQPLPPFQASCTICPEVDTALGDLTGRSSMIALLYGKIPVGNNDTYPGGSMGYLAQAAGSLFPGQKPGTINEEQFIDPLELFGYFSFPLNYRKRGVRFELAFQLHNDFGIKIQSGVSSIRQVVEKTVNLTNDISNVPQTDDVNTENVNTHLMNQLNNITEQMKLDIGDQNQASVEEVRFNLYWRHAFEINNNETNDWSQFLIIPYLEVSASISPGEKRKPNQLFAAPFGNNGHPSTGCTAGINFDLPATIEFGGEVGFTHFFKKSFCDSPVPNSQFQTTMFPFQTEVSVQPGNNWHFCARIASYHFVDNLSMHFEWLVIDHKQDKITLKTPDHAFLPGVLEKVTTFKTKLGNAGFNYDVSPNIGIGFLWQIPFSQRNTYRSSTVMGGVNVTF